MIAVIVVVSSIVPTWRSNERDVIALARLAVAHIYESHKSVRPPTTDADNPFRDLRATKKQKRVLDAARNQLGVKYVLGAVPRHRWSLNRVGSDYDPLGFDCSTLVAYAYLQGADIWIGGAIAHTDEIWTQNGKFPLTITPAKDSRVTRGTGAKPPSGGYKPGDLLFRREGAGGYWGHVLLVSERGYVIEALPPDVHETKEMTDVLIDGPQLGWMRIKGVTPE